MRHKKIGRKFGRESHQRLALLRSLCTSLVKYEKIETTLQKAKDLRREIEKAVTIAKKMLTLKGEDQAQTAGLKAAKRTLLEKSSMAAMIAKSLAVTRSKDTSPISTKKPAKLLKSISPTPKRIRDRNSSLATFPPPANALSTRTARV